MILVTDDESGSGMIMSQSGNIPDDDHIDDLNTRIE